MTHGRVFVAALAAILVFWTVLPAVAAAECDLTDADLAANAKLSFDDFDQQAVRPSTARKLVGRGCYAQAAQANEHYLLFGNAKTEGQQRVVRFHLGQVMALSGDERGAARVIAGTRNPVQPADATLDWNTYVVGVWAFLVKDHARLAAAQATLGGLAGDNPINAGALARLQRCFSRSYKDAMNAKECSVN